MVLDLGRFVVHSFTPEARSYYDIEGLWNSIDDANNNTSEDLSEDGSSEFHGEGLSNQSMEEADKRMLESVEMAWAGRPVVLVKTKQTEAEDVMNEAELVDRMNSGEVLRRK